MPRPKTDMDEDTFRACLDHVKFYQQHGQQVELNLAGIGESTMHPKLLDYLELARSKLGYTLPFVMATNGLIATEELAQAFSLYRLKVWVSAHRPEKAGRAVELYQRYGVLMSVSIDPSFSPVDWAGQVDF